MASLPNKLQVHLDKPFVRYVLIGGSVYVFELLVILVGQRQGLADVVAVGLSFWLGLILSFVLQKVFTFRDRRRHHRVLIPQAAAFTALVLFNFGFTIEMTRLLRDSLPAPVIRTLAIGITTLWNFSLYKTRIFKTDDNPVY